MASSPRQPYSPERRGSLYHRVRLYEKLMYSSNNALDFKIPAHIIDPALYFPLAKKGQSSATTIFSIWNTMIGSTVLSIPWAIELSGIIVGVIIIGAVGFLANYTCQIIVKYGFQFDLDDTSDIVTKFWGKKGLYISLVFSCLVLLTALMAYNVLLNSAFYNILNGIAIWSSGSPIACVGCWGQFSSVYTPFVLMGMLWYLGTFRNKETYIKMNSGGLLFVLIICVSIMAIGIRALAINTFTTGGSSDMQVVIQFI